MMMALENAEHLGPKFPLAIHVPNNKSLTLGQTDLDLLLLLFSFNPKYPEVD